MSYDSLMHIYETLLTAAGILFGVFGLWVGILYPGILEKSSNPQKYKQTISQSICLLRPLFVSLILFLVMLIIVFLAPFFHSINLPNNCRCIAKCISAGIAFALFLALLVEIIASMNQIEIFHRLELIPK